MNSILFSPHNDDAPLFASFIIQRDRPLVVTVFDCHRMVVSANHRRNEDKAAMRILGAEVCFLGISNTKPSYEDVVRGIRERFAGFTGTVYAPAIEKGAHPDHNMVGEAVKEVFGDRVKFYMTYTAPAGKSKGVPVQFEAIWPLKKLQALACYESQIVTCGMVEHFLREQYEYMLSGSEQ